MLVVQESVCTQRCPFIPKRKLGMNLTLVFWRLVLAYVMDLFVVCSGNIWWTLIKHTVYHYSILYSLHCWNQNGKDLLLVHEVMCTNSPQVTLPSNTKYIAYCKLIYLIRSLLIFILIAILIVTYFTQSWFHCLSVASLSLLIKLAMKALNTSLDYDVVWLLVWLNKQHSHYLLHHINKFRVCWQNWHTTCN